MGVLLSAQSWSWQRSLLRLLLCCSLILPACTTKVPEPTHQVHADELHHVSYRLHNIGPQRMGESMALAYADLNQDGHTDLLIGGTGPYKGFRIEWGDGRGHWRLQPGPLSDMEPRSLDVADVDLDGQREVMIAGEGDQKGIQIWSFDMHAKWTLHSVPVEGGVFSEARFADINEDGWPDIVATRMDARDDGGLFVWLNDGRGSWVTASGPMVSGIFTDVTVADLNQDGHLDIIAAQRRGGTASKAVKDRKMRWQQTGSVQVWYGDGTGRWEPEVLSLTSDVESVTVADVDADGKLDLIAGLYQNGIRLWRKGAHDWLKPEVVTDKGTWTSVRVGDLNADGARDLLAASRDGRGIGVWRWSAQQGFLPDPNLVPDQQVYLDIDLADVHHANLLAIAALRADGGVEVWSFREPAALPLIEVNEKPIAEPLRVLFVTADAALLPAGQRQIRAWLEDLRSHRTHFRVAITGHADERPIKSELYPNNLALSRARAEAVQRELWAAGVPRDQVWLAAKGDVEPAPAGRSPEALRLNRRVELIAYPINAVRLPQQVNLTAEAAVSKRDLYHIEANATFRTLNDIPEYIIGKGDELSITVWRGGHSEVFKVTVQTNGTVSLPYQEGLKVEDMTPSEVDATMTAVLKQYERHPRVDVLVLNARSKTTTIFGQIRDLLRQPTGPGTYFLKGRETLVDFISRAGGPTDKADLTKVQLIRDGKTIMLNLDVAIKQGDWTENALVDDGDTIFIPSLGESKRQVYVLGAVRDPGIVEFAGNIKLLEAVSKRGGFTTASYLSELRVIRQNRDQPEIVAVRFDRFMRLGDLSENIELRDKDVVIIPASPIANWNQVIAELMPTLNILLAPVTVYQQLLSIRTVSGAVGVVP